MDNVEIKAVNMDYAFKTFGDDRDSEFKGKEEEEKDSYRATYFLEE